MDIQNRKDEPYVVLASVSELDSDNLYHFTQTQSPFDALNEDGDEGTLVFGIGLTVDRETNSFPKSMVWYRIGLRFEDSCFKIRLYKREYIAFPEADAESLGKDKLEHFFEQMLEFAKESYRRDPWVRPNAGAPIGFINGS